MTRLLERITDSDVKVLALSRPSITYVGNPPPPSQSLFFFFLVVVVDTIDRENERGDCDAVENNLSLE